MGAHFHSAHFTHVGKVRAKNEDAVLSLGPENIWVIADGMGGYEYGEIASRMVIEAIQHQIFSGSLEERVAMIKDALYRVNHHLSQEKTLSQSAVIGSTVCLLIAFQGHIACLWAGDSRCYLYRRNRLYQVSRDHSQRLNGRSVLTRAIGMGSKLNIEHCILAVQNDDTFLLTTDGLHNALTAKTIQASMSSDSPIKGSEKLKTKALQTEASDNLSAIMIKVTP
ncbi:PP2C family protein-serine/threonine phosphatase [Photobacterium lipolyticum]|uniref:Serine/threonine-protein phosphatase n=1 Tax=Photobacterium lipolyticum TaxID=266810 RepID=A0A2T3MYR3_9GAMM|nr:protein phosphatase 2C domain-containing protein [Photobacterium lipolyticum]PSW05094.1 serine/threonine-protein phosphatase [Photobacterium lipolyticum]